MPTGKLFDEQLDSILNPQSVTLVGVSREPDSYTYASLSITLNYGYSGKLYVVNPNSELILGVKCYPRVVDTPEATDLAVVMTNRKYVRESVEQCIAKGVKGVVIFTSGFGETSEEGRKEEAELVDLARRSRVRIIGPNCLGIFSARANFDGTMAGYTGKGPIGLVLQSGNLIRSIVFPARKRGIGFSHIISLGNQADLQFDECIRYLRNDPETKVIALYVEGLKNGRAFVEEVTQTVKEKPVIVLKIGRSEVGVRAAVSHTASLAGSDELYEGIFRQCGAIRVDWPSELPNLSHALVTHKLPSGRRVGVLTEGGGDSVVVGDNCEQYGLEVCPLPEEKKRRILALSPALVNVGNPIDYGTGVPPSVIPEIVPKIAEIMLEGDDLDGLLFVGGFGGYGFWYEPFHRFGVQGANNLIEFLRKCEKPIVFHNLYAVENAQQFDMLREAGVQIYLTHEEAVRTMATLATYGEIKRRFVRKAFHSKINGSPGKAFERTAGKVVLEPEARRFIAKYNLPSPRYGVARDEREAARLAKDLGYPVALKVVSPDILHKTEAGGVKLSLTDGEQVKKAFKDIVHAVKMYNMDAQIEAMLVTRMVDPGAEVIIGGLNDPTFGPVVMFGLGGILVEAMKQVSFRVAPFDESDALEMINELPAHRVLKGFRGRRYDIKAVKRAILSVSDIMLKNSEINQLDLNPVSVYENGLSVLDARIILK